MSKYPLSFIFPRKQHYTTSSQLHPCGGRSCARIHVSQAVAPGKCSAQEVLLAGLDCSGRQGSVTHHMCLLLHKSYPCLKKTFELVLKFYSNLLLPIGKTFNDRDCKKAKVF